ncbi:MAG TPA: thioredoxin family protein [Terriglobales bacterium]|nr:thioredoxin family protein [Terriglobales bacterium]
MADAGLARYAGQFVWLELNYDKPANAEFLKKFGAYATPTFFIIDPRDEKIVATQTGAMSLTDLGHFLDRGASAVVAKTQTPADAALTRGDALFTTKPDEAVTAYQEAIRLSPASWPRRELAEASLTVALQNSQQWQRCAETASTEAGHMSRSEAFGRTVVAGMWCMVSAHPAPWWETEAAKLEPLAKEGLSLPSTVRDHRDELYRTLMYLSLDRKDERAAAKWGDLWLKELDAINPISDEQRSAIDIARVEDIQVFGDPNRVLPALIASERAMPDNWNASLRVAQMEDAAKNYDAAIAACDRGLARHPGPGGSAWLLVTKADALQEKGNKVEARRVLGDALEAAKGIPNERSRENNVNRIKQLLQQSGG